MSEPLRSTLEVQQFEELLDHLEAALAPRVTFSADVEAMQTEADASRIADIEAAMSLVFGNVGGLRIRPSMGRLNTAQITEGSAT